MGIQIKYKMIIVDKIKMRIKINITKRDTIENKDKGWDKIIK